LVVSNQLRASNGATSALLAAREGQRTLAEMYQLLVVYEFCFPCGIGVVVKFVGIV
jgi:hypothetical protein